MSNILSEQDEKSVREMLARQLDVKESQVTYDARIEADLMADSLDKVEIVMMMEEHFDVSIPDESAERIISVRDLLEALAELLQQGRR